MNKLFLADFHGLSVAEVYNHIIDDYGFNNDVRGYEILIAYESVGDCGCDSTSFFLLRKDDNLYEVHCSHCSCDGFESQFEPELTNIEYLKSKHFYFHTGGYDYSSEENKNEVNSFISSLAN